MQGSPVTGVAQPADPISSAWFGVIQTGYGTQGPFSEQLEWLSGGPVRWPGGTLAETKDDVYDLRLPDLFDGRSLFKYNPGRQRPGLSDLVEAANSRDQGLSVVIPTARYADDIGGGVGSITDFLSRLLRGEFGKLPDRLTLEIGNEYYGQQEFNTAPAQYGRVANAMIEATARSLDLASPDVRDKISIAVQMGKTAADDTVIRSQMSRLTLQTIDAVVFHALPVSLENFHAGSRSAAAADQGLSRVERTRLYTDAWKRAVDEAGGASDLDLLASAWSVGASAMTATDLDLDRQDYGARGAGTALEIFAAFSYLGVSGASVWGVDVPNLSRLSDDAGDDVSVSSVGATFALMASSLPGTRLLEPYRPQDRSDQVMSYLYGDDDRLVLFVAANDIATGGTTVSRDLQAYGATSIISARSLGWRDGDGSLTGTALDRLDEVPVLLPAAAKLADGDLSVMLRQDYEVVQVILRRQIEARPVAGESGGDTTDAVLPAGVEVGVGPGPEAVTLGGGDDLIRWQELTPYPLGVYAQNVGSPAVAGTGQVVDVAGKLRMRAIIDGGEGRDRLMLTQADDALFLHDDVSLFPAMTAVGGGARLASVEVVKAGAGNDVIDLTSPQYSLAGTSLSLFGQVGDDILWGSDADERIDGGEGDDIIFGGTGRDRLSGGAGADTFQFLPTSVDQTILDFDPSEGDVIHLFSGQSRAFTGRAELRDDRFAFELLGRDGSRDYLSVRVRDVDLMTEDLSALYLIVG